MKKYLFYLMLLVALSVHATSKDTVNALRMASYEQTWSDNQGTLALKNNTKHTIYNVRYRLTYFDMKGNPMDYKDFYTEIEIAPGMTKKVNVEGYECDRNYSYYLSEACPSHPKKFKISYETLAYNQTEESCVQLNTDALLTKESPISEMDDEPTYLNNVVMIIIMLFVLAGYVGFYVLVAIMAQRRNRSAALWLLLSFIATPILVILILLVIGKAPECENLS
jgi:hypothetical protein